jgi:large subunit ribosomal protein L6
MSRVGRAPITLPKGVDINLNMTGTEMTVKGPKGSLKVPVSPRIKVKNEAGTLSLERSSDARDDRAQHGLARALINNAVTGVSTGYSRNLEIQGVGFRCAMKGKTLELSIGFSHPVAVTPPEGITISSPEQTKITISGIDKQLVGQVAANIRELRPPDAYQGKGIRYEGEYVKLKPGKAAAK